MYSCSNLNECITYFFRPISFLKIWISISRRQPIYRCMAYCGVWIFCAVCLYNRLYTKMLRIHLFSIFTIKTPRGFNRLATYTCTPTITDNYTMLVLLYGTLDKNSIVPNEKQDKLVQNSSVTKSAEYELRVRQPFCSYNTFAIASLLCWNLTCK